MKKATLRWFCHLQRIEVGCIRCQEEKRKAKEEVHGCGKGRNAAGSCNRRRYEGQCETGKDKLWRPINEKIIGTVIFTPRYSQKVRFAKVFSFSSDINKTCQTTHLNLAI